jgi:Flp pilus assembly protein TadG
MLMRFGLKPFLKAEEGATAIEFAMVAGPFFWFFLSMFETGLMLFTDYALQSGVQQAARLVRTGQMQNGVIPVQFQNLNFRQILCKQAAIIPSCNSKVSIKVQAASGTMAAFKNSIPNVLAVGPTAAGGAATYDCNPGRPQENVVVIATYDWKYFLPFMNAFSNISQTSTRRLVGYAMFQNEPFQNNGPVGAC